MSYAAGKQPRTLTRDEQRRLLELSGKRADDYADHMLFALALGTGLRVHELSALDLGDVFNDAGGARQRVTLRVYKGAARRGAPQEVFVSGALRGKLARDRKWLARRGVATDAGAPVFVVRGGRRMSARRMRERFDRWRTFAALAPWLSFHSLRHTFCQRLYDTTGGNIRLVQVAARHANIATTTIYAAPSTDQLLGAIEGIDV